MATTSIPWLPSSDQFMRAIVAGAELGESRARRQMQERELNRPRFFGGGGFRPIIQREAPVEEPAAPTGPHMVLNGSILSMVDPSINQMPVKQPAPFEAGGRTFVTNPATGQVEPFVEPSTIEKVGNDLVRVFPRTFEAKQLYEGGKTAGEGVTMSVPIFPPGVNPVVARALGMEPTVIRGPMDQVAQRVGTNAPSMFQTPGQAVQEVIRRTSDGRRAVFDASTKQFLRYAD